MLVKGLRGCFTTQGASNAEFPLFVSPLNNEIKNTCEIQIGQWN